MKVYALIVGLGCLSAAVFFFAIWLEYPTETRYSKVAMGSLHLFVGAGGALLFMCAVGLLWERMATLPGHWMFGCLVAASLMAVGGYKVEQMVNHAAWHSEKSRGILIVGGCGLLVILACLVNAIVLRSWGARKSALHGP